MPQELEFTRVDRPLVEKAAAVVACAKEKKRSIVTAESCTGGLLAAVLSEAPGAGDWLHGGFVTYTKENKASALGISTELLNASGAVSEPVARAMAEGALAHSPADLAVAVTGVAGPKPDEDGTPVGIVHIALARRGAETLHKQHQFGDIGRGPCRYSAVKEALELLEKALKDE